MSLDDMSGYKVSSGEPDVRGWPVQTRDGQRIGKVATLIIDTTELRARYIEVDLDRDALKLSSSRRITLPIGNARIDDNADIVVLPEHSPVELGALPPSSGTLTHDDELRIRRSFDDRYTPDANLYAHANYDQTRFFGTRRHGRENRDYLSRDETGARSTDRRH